MMMKWVKIGLAFSLIFSPAAFAWNNIGHRIIAQIAYDQLTPASRHQVDALTAVMFHSRYPAERFSRASTWPDRIKAQTRAYNSWHYINLPYVKNHIKPPALAAQNVVWAILFAEKNIENTREMPAQRAFYLSFLVHLVGDIMQPMHCVTLYSAHFPMGDRGGNDYMIHSAIAANLHQLWDRGLGLFVSDQRPYAFHYQQIQKIARAWMQRYPRTVLAAQLQQTTPQQWAAHSHQLAVTFAYTLSENTAPTAQYLQQGQQIVKQQIVLAGDQLADILNTIFQES